MFVFYYSASLNKHYHISDSSTCLVTDERDYDHRIKKTRVLDQHLPTVSCFYIKQRSQLITLAETCATSSSFLSEQRSSVGKCTWGWWHTWCCSSVWWLLSPAHRAALSSLTSSLSSSQPSRTISPLARSALRRLLRPAHLSTSSSPAASSPQEGWMARWRTS